MKEGKEMFEAIEMHVERMLAKRSENEKQTNPALGEHERRMKAILDRLRKIVTSQPTTVEEVEDSDANV